jgi:hypothetical protein
LALNLQSGGKESQFVGGTHPSSKAEELYLQRAFGRAELLESVSQSRCLILTDACILNARLIRGRNLALHLAAGILQELRCYR